MVAKPAQHEHAHTPNRYAVIPTPERLQATGEYTGKGVTIAILDSGFYPHADLVEPVNRIIAYHDVTNPQASLNTNAPAQAWQWHGTQTSVAACGNGFLSDGIYRGLASDAGVVLVKVSRQGRITDEQIVQGLRWVIENQERYNIRIVSMSLGGDADVALNESAVNQAAELAVGAGLVLVVAAGNSGCANDPHPIPPASAPSVITVGGYDDNNELHNSSPDLYCSNFGATVDGLVKPEIIAPAMWVAAPILPNTDAYKRAEALSHLATAPDYLLQSLIELACNPECVLHGFATELWERSELPGKLYEHTPQTIRALVEVCLRDSKIVATHYQHVDGTSFATPVVASVVAQMLEANPRLTPAAVKNILISTADRIPDTDVIRQGFGMLNARRAVEQAKIETHILDDNELFSPRIEEGRLVFAYHDDAAEQVAIVGDFNQWNPTQTVFEKVTDGIWRVAIAPPPPGEYRYKFVVNRHRWIEDPSNLMKEPDSFGGLNSVLSLA
ncbi:MAG: S8 family serine peptidase [Acidobacteriota bacterium]